MNIALDLSGDEHYRGPANLDADGNYGIMNGDGMGSIDDEGTSWSGGFSRSKSASDAPQWSPTLAEPASIGHWVSQQ